MTGRLDGKVAFITGAARGQGRSHCIRLAQEGADIIAIDVAEQIGSAPYPLATPEDLARTVKEVEALDRRIIATRADVRDFDAVSRAVDAGVAEFGRLDIVLGNAGMMPFAPIAETTETAWREVIDVNLTGVFHTVKASIPHLVAGGRGGSIVLTSSSAGLKGLANLGHYTAAKHGVVGLMRTLTLELAPHMIRVNTVHPCSVNTPMVHNPAVYSLFVPGPEAPTTEEFLEVAKTLNVLPINEIEPVDVSNAIVFLCSDEGRYITGARIPIDAGMTMK